MARFDPGRLQKLGSDDTKLVKTGSLFFASPLKSLWTQWTQDPFFLTANAAGICHISSGPRAGTLVPWRRALLWTDRHSLMS
eukprot:399445-Amphidinium_carterae.1